MERFCLDDKTIGYADALMLVTLWESGKAIHICINVGK